MIDSHALHPLLLGPMVLVVSSCGSPGGLSAGSTLRTFDNDSPQRSDDQYTSGLSFSYVSDDLESFEASPLTDSVGRWLDRSFDLDDHDQPFVIFSASQRIFTPTDLDARHPVEGDLPYSASLYGTVVAGTQDRDRLDAISLTAGLVGPLALGEQTQKAIHRWIGSAEPRGWEHQLETEPLVNFGYDHRRRLTSFGNRAGFGGDLLGGVSASLGNLQSQVSIGTTVRYGFRTPTNFHMPTHFLAEESLGLRAYDEPEGDGSWYLYAGAVATALGNAIYLDGNTFRGSHSVDHEDHILRSSVGLATRYRRLLVTISLESNTIPWNHPDGLDHERYARIGVSWDFWVDRGPRAFKA